MMTTVVALREEEIQVAVGQAGAKPQVQGLYSAPAPGGGPEAWSLALEKLWKERDLPRKDITLVLPHVALSVKTVPVPANLSEKQRNELARHELQTRETSHGDMIAGCLPLGKDKEGRLSLFCAGGHRDEVGQYLDLMQGVGLKVSRITAPMAGYLKVLDAIDEGGSSIWLLFEESSVLSLLIEEGRCSYATRSRIFSEPGTVDFGTEITRNVSGTLQFQAANRSGHTAQRVFYAGCPDDIFEACQAGIESLGLAAAPLPGGKLVNDLPGKQKLSDWLDCVSGLVTVKQDMDLYRPYRKGGGKVAGKKKEGLTTFYLPVAITLAVCLVASLAVIGSNVFLSHKESRIQDWLDDPAVIEQHDKAVQKQTVYDQLMEDIREVNGLTQALGTYPTLDRTLNSRIQVAGGGQVSAQLTGYDAATGVLLFQATSANVIDIPGYVLALQNTGLFQKVQYTGYAYDEGQYVLSLSCVLQGPDQTQGEEGTTP